MSDSAAVEEKKVEEVKAEEKKVYPPFDKDKLVIDKAWRGTEDFEIVLAYIEASRPTGRIIEVGDEEEKCCPICKESLSYFMSVTPDGAWTFKSMLGHLLLYHGVKPVDEFVISAKQWFESPAKLTARDILKIDIFTDRISLEADNIEDIISKFSVQQFAEVRTGTLNVFNGVKIIRSFLSCITVEEGEKGEPVLVIQANKLGESAASPSVVEKKKKKKVKVKVHVKSSGKA